MRRDRGGRSKYLRVHTVGDEDQETLQGSEYREEHKEDELQNVLFDEHHDESEDPRQTDRDEDGEVYSDLFPFLLFICFRCGLNRKSVSGEEG